MKHLYLLSLLGLSTLAYSQSDSVSIGAGYQNEVWYSLSQGELAQNNIADWDVAFDVSPTGYAVRINAGAGTRAWAYPGDTSEFATLDTTGMGQWTELTNGEMSWFEGALNSLENGLDVGWGQYNMNTHVISANRIFVLELSNGVYQKFMINSLTTGVFYFRHATLDNSMDMNHQLDKSTFQNKNFGYFNLKSHSSVDLEPTKDSWDLYFGKYTADLGIPYNVTGTLLNNNVEAIKAYPVNDPANTSDWYAYTFGTDMNIIGYDWKSYNFSAGGYDMADSTVYFVKDQEGDIYRIIFTEFEGSATGDIVFDITLVSALSTEEVATAQLLSVYPNPATDYVKVVLDSDAPSTIEIINLNGQVVAQSTAQSTGLQSATISTEALVPGMYIVKVTSNGATQTERLIIK